MSNSYNEPSAASSVQVSLVVQSLIRVPAFLSTLLQQLPAVQQPELLVVAAGGRHPIFQPRVDSASTSQTVNEHSTQRMNDELT